MSIRLIKFAILIFSNLTFAQTENKNLNLQLNEMKKCFLAEDYKKFSNFTYPKAIEMMGGASNMVKITEEAMNKMKNEGFTYIDLIFKNPSKFLYKNGEMQCSLIQQITIQTPKVKIEAEYTLIAISTDKGLNWTFIDTSGKSKDTMLKYFPNLDNEIVIHPKTQKIIN